VAQPEGVFLLEKNMDRLTKQELEMLLSSMEYTKRAFEDTAIDPYGPYPSYEFKRQRIDEAHAVIIKLRALKRHADG
jgi:hypothetical protein